MDCFDYPTADSFVFEHQFLDKTLLNYGSIFGLKEDLHLKGSNFSWLGR